MKIIECPALGMDVDLDLVKHHAGWCMAASAWSLLAQERKICGNDVDADAAAAVASDCCRIVTALIEEGK
jgi:hypothetical protein